MSKYKIANFVTEINPIYDNFKNLLKPFECNQNEKTDIKLFVSKQRIEEYHKKMADFVLIGQTEEFLYAGQFNKSIIDKNAMLVHSSAIKFNGKAYLFSARSGGGKSTHTKLWQKAFGNSVKIINDDKPVVKFENEKCIVYGTPFDGGSGIATTDFAELDSIVFVKKANQNSIRKATKSEIISNLYISTIRKLNSNLAEKMLNNFEWLICKTNFYILECNESIDSALVAKNFIVK